MSELFDRLKTALADRYAIQEEIGAGGMATVYLARDLKHDRAVAVKVLRQELAAALGAERFHRMASVLASGPGPPLHVAVQQYLAGGHALKTRPAEMSPRG